MESIAPVRHVSRRTLAVGAAWAVPTLALAAAAPALAASGEIWFEPVGLACKSPGASCQQETGITKGYVVRVRMCSSFTQDVTVTVHDAMVSLSGNTATAWEVSADPQNPWLIGSAPDPGGTADPIFRIPASTTDPMCTLVDFGIQGTPSSTNVSISGSAPFNWVTSNDAGTGTVEMSATQTPPCDHCEIVDVPNP